jgi:hypothetical protein
MSRNDERFLKWRPLQRERALTLLELRGINSAIEGLKPKLRSEGYELPLDG